MGREGRRGSGAGAPRSGVLRFSQDSIRARRPIVHDARFPPHGRPRPPVHPLVLAFGAILLWSSFAALGVRLAGTPPFLLVGIALLVGGAMALPRLARWEFDPRVIALGVYGVFCYHFALFTALRLAPAVEANLLNYLWPLLIVVLTPAFLPGTRLAPRHVAAGVMGFAGTAILVTGADWSLEPGRVAGYGLAIAAAVVWATYSLGTRRMRDFSTETVGLFCLVAGALGLACHFAFEPPHAVPPADWPWLAVLGFGPCGAAFYLWDAALKRGDPRGIGALAYLTPLLSTAILAGTTGGAVGPRAAIALALIVAGAVVGNWPVKPRVATPASSPGATSPPPDR